MGILGSLGLSGSLKDPLLLRILNELHITQKKLDNFDRYSARQESEKKELFAMEGDRKLKEKRINLMKAGKVETIRELRGRINNLLRDF